jgi:hypothetical protein
MAPVLRAAMVELSRNQNYRERMKFFSIALIFSMLNPSAGKLPFAWEAGGRHGGNLVMACHNAVQKRTLQETT